MGLIERHAAEMDQLISAFKKYHTHTNDTWNKSRRIQQFAREIKLETAQEG